MSNNSVTFEAIDTDKLSGSDIIQIAEVEKDMWAHWIWEYVKCNCCWKIHSKDEIFQHLASKIKKESVIELEKIFLWDTINCNECSSWNTKFLYDIEENIENIKERLFNSLSSHIVLVKKDNDLVWIMDWYYDSIENIYKRELEYRYNRIGLNEVKMKIEEDRNINQHMYTFSTFWIIEKYNNLKKSFLLFKKFFETMPKEYLNFQLLVELDVWKIIHLYYNSFWIEQIGFEWNPLLQNRWKDYNSDLFFLNSLLKINSKLEKSYDNYFINKKSKK